MMSTTDINLSKLLEIEPIEGEIEEIEPTPNQNTAIVVANSTTNQPSEEMGGEEVVDDDATFARDRMIHVINSGDTAIELIKNIAHESMHPKAIEVMSMLLKTQSESIDKLLKIQRDRKEIKNIGKSKDQQNTTVAVANAVFIGSTADLLKKVKNKQSE